MTLKQLIEQYAENMTSSILEMNSISKKEMKTIIISQMMTYTREMSRCNFKNANNSLTQYQAIMSSASATEKAKQEAARKIKELTALKNSSNMLFTESVRDNKYKALRRFVESKGLGEALTEFDQNLNTTEKLC